MRKTFINLLVLSTFMLGISGCSNNSNANNSNNHKQTIKKDDNLHLKKKEFEIPAGVAYSEDPEFYVEINNYYDEGVHIDKDDIEVKVGENSQGDVRYSHNRYAYKYLKPGKYKVKIKYKDEVENAVLKVVEPKKAPKKHFNIPSYRGEDILSRQIEEYYDKENKLTGEVEAFFPISINTNDYGNQNVLVDISTKYKRLPNELVNVSIYQQVDKVILTKSSPNKELGITIQITCNMYPYTDDDNKNQGLYSYSVDFIINNESPLLKNDKKILYDILKNEINEWGKQDHYSNSIDAFEINNNFKIKHQSGNTIYHSTMDSGNMYGCSTDLSDIIDLAMDNHFEMDFTEYKE